MSAPARVAVTVWHICDGSRPRADRLVIRPSGGPGRCRRTQRTRQRQGTPSGQMSPEPRRARQHQPGGPPPGSTATTLTDQAAEDRSTPDPAVDRLGNRRCRARRAQPQRSMRPPRVVVGGVHGKHLAQVSLSEDQHPVGDLGPDGQHEAFGEAVRPRTARRDLDHLDARVRQDRVERRRELPGPVADEEPEPGGVFAEVHDEVAGLLCGPGPSGCPVMPSTCR